MRARRILILGGTADAVVLAKELVNRGLDVVTSLAGVTENPTLPVGDVRIGGFGGEDGMVEFIKADAISDIADATHPFAARISRHAFNAAQRTGISYVRFERAPWSSLPADQWVEVADVPAAVAAVPQGATVMLTIGRKEIAGFIARPDLSGVARMIEAPAVDPPPRWQVLQARPPFTVEGEHALLREHAITHLVSKNSGGKLTVAKLVAARALRIPVVMISRPRKPQATTFSSALALAAALAGEGPPFKV